MKLEITLKDFLDSFIKNDIKISIYKGDELPVDGESVDFILTNFKNLLDCKIDSIDANCWGDIPYLVFKVEE